MSIFVPWNSQPLSAWAEKYARGNIIQLDGLQTHYREKGQGDPVILLHGFYFDSHLWDKNIDALAKHHRVYVLDLWGFGYSTRDLLDFGYPLYARQLELFMDALDIDQATLIGQSMGGGTIIQFCTNNWGRVHKIVLVDPAILPVKLPLLGQIANLPGVGEFLFEMQNDFMRTFTLKNTFIYNRAILTPEYLETVTRFQKVAGTTEVMLKILRKQFFHTLAEEVRQVGELAIPALVIGGRQSAAEPTEHTQQVHVHLAGSRLAIIDQAGHCPNAEQAETFNQLVRQFLAF